MTFMSSLSSHLNHAIRLTPLVELSLLFWMFLSRNTGWNKSNSSPVSQMEEFIPERGFAKNIASRFKQLESSAKSPPVSPGRHKEFTPPRETDQPTVRESKPAETNPEVVHSGDMVEEALPEKGTARNMMQRFKQLEAESK